MDRVRENGMILRKCVLVSFLVLYIYLDEQFLVFYAWREYRCLKYSSLATTLVNLFADES